jgi:hypothetical protein
MFSFLLRLSSHFCVEPSTLQLALGGGFALPPLRALRRCSLALIFRRAPPLSFRSALERELCVRRNHRRFTFHGVSLAPLKTAKRPPAPLEPVDVNAVLEELGTALQLDGSDKGGGAHGGAWVWERASLERARALHAPLSRARAPRAPSLPPEEDLSPEALRAAAVKAATTAEGETEDAKLAREIAQKSPLAVQMLKVSFNAVENLSLEDGYRIEQDKTIELSKSEDAQEAGQAFVEKRKPVFKGR